MIIEILDYKNEVKYDENLDPVGEEHAKINSDKNIGHYCSRLIDEIETVEIHFTELTKEGMENICSGACTKESHYSIPGDKMPKDEKDKVYVMVIIATRYDDEEKRDHPHFIQIFSTLKSYDWAKYGINILNNRGELIRKY